MAFTTFLLVIALAITSADASHVLFMQGDGQELGGNNLWSLDRSTLNATLLKALPDKYMTSSRGAMCDKNKYYTIYWWLPDPSTPTLRRYGIGEFNSTSWPSNIDFTPHEFPDYYYGVWCDPGAPGSLILVASTRQNNNDPLLASEFHVMKLNTNTWDLETITSTPVRAPDHETIPVGDGIFSFDGKTKIWMSFSVNKPFTAKANAGVTIVVDLGLPRNEPEVFYTKAEEGYLMNVAATESYETWGVLKRLKRRDTKLVLTLAKIKLTPTPHTNPVTGTVDVSAVTDVSNTMNSFDLPATQCTDHNQTLVFTYNTDDVHWFNLTAVDALTGAVAVNLDTLDLLPGQRFAYVTGFACY